MAKIAENNKGVYLGDMKTIKDLDLKDKNPEFVLYSGSGQAQKATEKIKALFNKEPTILKAPKKHKAELEKLKNL